MSNRLFPVCAAFSTVWSLLVLARIDNGMAYVQVRNAPAYTISDLAGHFFSSAADVNSILSTWYAVPGLYSSVTFWRWCYAVVGLLSAISCTALLWWLLTRGPRAKDPALDVGPFWKSFLPTALLVVWIAEDLSELSDSRMVHIPLWPSTDVTQVLRWPNAWLIHTLSWAKWLLAIVLALMVLLNVIGRVNERKKSLRKAMSLAGQLRVQLVTVVVFALLMIAPVTEQPYDMLRRSAEGWPVLLTALVAVFIFSLVLLYSDASTAPRYRKRVTPPWSLLACGGLLLAVSWAPHVIRLRAPAIMLLGIWSIGALSGMAWLYTDKPVSKCAGSITDDEMARAHFEAAYEDRWLVSTAEPLRLRVWQHYLFVAPIVVTALALGGAETDPAVFGLAPWGHRVVLLASWLVAIAALVVTGYRIRRSVGGSHRGRRAWAGWVQSASSPRPSQCPLPCGCVSTPGTCRSGWAAWALSRCPSQRGSSQSPCYSGG
ncbi:hypothetical protein ABZ770_33880 [Streptomyces sp. NPDC006654]|uniref:hypothetical protein n=1 Tax=Streptomyces sp. NPDC006654 TaxID=3156897 RepID=UPI0033EBCBE7